MDARDGKLHPAGANRNALSDADDGKKMIRNPIRLALAACVLSFTSGCSDEPEPILPELSAALSQPTSIPDHWAQISVTKVELGGVLKVTVKGKKQKIEGIVAAVADSVPKPIKLAPGVNTDQTLEEFEFSMDGGSWPSLLASIAKEFECTVSESSSEFLVTPNE